MKYKTKGKKRNNEENINRVLNRISNIIYSYRMLIILSYLVLIVIFFSVQFHLLQNWDMLSRILNANFLFHNGNYFEDQRAPLENLLIGIFSLFLGGYAVYAFIALSTLIFFLSLSAFSDAFNIKLLVLVLIVFNPFFLFYSMKNGSELLLFSFLIFYVSSIKKRDPLSGLFLALAFLSKYDALFFSPLLLFMLRKDLRSIRNFFLAIITFLTTLTPYFVYNFSVFHNSIYPLAKSFIENSGSGLIPSISGNLEKYGWLGLYELIPIAVITSFIIIFEGKYLRKILKDRSKILDVSILSLSVIISIYIYLAVGHLFTEGIGVYRFFLGISLFLTLLLALFTKKVDITWLLPFAAASFMIAVIMLNTVYPVALSNQNLLRMGISAFSSLYNTTNCTVESNEWVPLNYYGLSATYIRNDTPSLPIVNFYGPINTTLPLRYDKNEIYIYGGQKCVYIPPVDLPGGYYNDVNLSKADPALACRWLFDSKIKSSLLLDTCEYLT
mgnify:CR=1 FL=1